MVLHLLVSSGWYQMPLSLESSHLIPWLVPLVQLLLFTWSDLMMWCLRATPSTWGGLVDVQHAFRNLPINPFQAGLLAIEFNGHYYWELRAPFGWILAPFSWCRVSSVIQRYCSLHGINCVVYVDDFLVLGETFSETQNAIEFLINFPSDMSLPDKVSKRIPPQKWSHF